MMLSFSINSSCFIITFAVTSNSYGRVGWLNQRMSEPLKPRPQWFGKSSVLNHFAHAGGGRNWMTGPDLAHHRWIKSFIPNWQHTLLGLSMCQAYFCIHFSYMNISMISNGQKIWADSSETLSVQNVFLKRFFYFILIFIYILCKPEYISIFFIRTYCSFIVHFQCTIQYL